MNKIVDYYIMTTQSFLIGKLFHEHYHISWNIKLHIICCAICYVHSIYIFTKSMKPL